MCLISIGIPPKYQIHISSFVCVLRWLCLKAFETPNGIYFFWSEFKQYVCGFSLYLLLTKFNNVKMFLRAGELKYFCEYINFVTTFISSFLNFDTLLRNQTIWIVMYQNIQSIYKFITEFLLYKYVQDRDVREFSCRGWVTLWALRC